MSRLKITKGKAEVISYSDEKELVAFVNIKNGKSIISITNPFDNKYFDAELIADAFNTANECDLMPSELLGQRDDLIKRLQSLVLSMAAHPDCTEGSEFDDLSSLAQELINKIKNK